MDEEHKEHHHGHKHKKSDNLKIDKVTLWQIISGILLVVLIFSIYTEGFNFGTGAIEKAEEAGEVQQTQKIQEVSGTAGMKGLIDDDSVKGDPSAPVTIVEWSDFECPFCGRHYDQTAGKIIEEYVDIGKVKLVFRDFPLSFHRNAQKAAEAAECAGEQQRYWDMHDKLFDNRQKLSVSDLKQYAADLGLYVEKFDECLDSGKMALEVAEDMKAGQAAGITGTPGFLVNGGLIVGACPFNTFKQAIEAELNGKEWEVERCVLI